MGEGDILRKPENFKASFQVVQVKIPSKEKYNEILADMVLAFYKQRKGCETERSTEDYCKSIIDTCLTGFHRDGRLWKRAPGKHGEEWFDVLHKRLNVFKYDLITKQLNPSGKKSTAQKIRDKGKDEKEVSSFGPSDRSFSKSENDNFYKFQEQFIKDFPESITAVDKMMIERLAFLMVLSKRDIDNVDLSKDLTKEIRELAETLGVSGKQRATAMNQERSGTLELLTTKYKKTLEEHIEIETSEKLEELKMISNAVKRGSTPEFLAMSWVKVLYGDNIDGESISMKVVDKFLRKNGIDV